MFLSNFYVSSKQIQYEGLEADSVESAFQAMKSLDLELRKQIAAATPTAAKRLGRRLQIREDWLKIRTQVMHDLLETKFNNLYLSKLLLATGDEPLVEGNYWHDNFWGDCSCTKCEHIKGQNYLGRILMLVRDELKRNQ